MTYEESKDLLVERLYLPYLRADKSGTARNLDLIQSQRIDSKEIEREFYGNPKLIKMLMMKVGEI